MWKLDKERPICPQICEILCVKIAVGELKPNQKLMSVRELAVKTGVNPNTVQKAFEQLESKNLIYSVRSSGWYVSESVNEAQKTVEDLRSKRTEKFFGDMEVLGFTNDQTKNYIKEWQL